MKWAPTLALKTRVKSFFKTYFTKKLRTYKISDPEEHELADQQNILIGRRSIMSDILTGDAGARDWQTLTDGLRPLGYRQLSQTYIIDGGLHHCPQGNGTPTRAFQAPCRHRTALPSLHAYVLD